MALQHQTDKNFLLFEDHISQISFKDLPILHSSWNYCFWTNHVILVQHEKSKADEYCQFTAFDLLMNETRQIRLRKTDNTFTDIFVHQLIGDFAVIKESKLQIFHATLSYKTIYSISLFKIDWETGEFCLTQRFDSKFSDVYIDKFARENFILSEYDQNTKLYQYTLCKLSQNGKIEWDDEIHQSETNFKVYSQNNLIGYEAPSLPRAQIYNLVTRKEEIVKFEVPINNEIDYICDYNNWVKNNIYSIAHFKNGHNGIMWSNLEERKWTLVKNFKTDLKRKGLYFRNDNLIACFKKEIRKGSDIVLSSQMIYEIPVKRPNHLRKMAWLRVVKIMKKREEKDPYKMAKEFLPLNSDLRAPWFKNEEKKKETTGEDVPVKKLKPNHSN